MKTSKTLTSPPGRRATRRNGTTPGARADRAERGQANAAALALLSLALGLPVKRLRVVKGAKSPSKIISVLGER
ncbi:MAG: DUF167 domain-containing protein [Elusimicrobia bacterium]|nr:DUF167 domain-containing protein [Elusimicrobiota bacterium]